MVNKISHENVVKERGKAEGRKETWDTETDKEVRRFGANNLRPDQLSQIV